jgi:hypothetical protein
MTRAVEADGMFGFASGSDRSQCKDQEDNRDDDVLHNARYDDFMVTALLELSSLTMVSQL